MIRVEDHLPERVCVGVCVNSGGARRAGEGEGEEQLLSVGTDVAILGEQEQKRRKSFASKKKREKNSVWC